MWAYLAFLVCTSGNVCFTTVPYEPPLAGISACQMQGMMIAPQWQAAHPGYTVKRIRCRIGKEWQREDAA
jgi:hypothetical protein